MYDVPEPEAVKWSRAWHSATEFLQLPDRTFDTPSNYLENARLDIQRKQITDETREALSLLLLPHVPGLHEIPKEYDLMYWYCNEIWRHFITNVQPILCTVCESCDTQRQ